MRNVRKAEKKNMVFFPLLLLLSQVLGTEYAENVFSNETLGNNSILMQFKGMARR